MKRILVIRFSALGDVAMLVPIVRAAAEQNPDVEFTILSRQQTSALWRGLPANVVFYGADLKGSHKGRKGLRKLLDEVDFKNVDAVADMHSVWRSWYLDLVFLLHGIPVRRIDKGRTSKWLLTHGVRHDAVKRTIERYREVFGRLGIQCTLNEPTFTENGKSGIGIAPFAAKRGKQYPLERMEQFVASRSKQERIYLFGGGKREVEILQGWADRYENVECVAGKHKMEEELEIMRGLRLMVTMDSGNMHLASLVGTRVISLWGATDPKCGFLGWGQKESDCKMLNLPCRPCAVYGERKCKFGDYRCLDYIIEL